MADDTLTERERHVLEAVVRNHILSAAPTGSRFLAKNPEFALSAATLRNVMGDLEEKGYISQPHTSAGRVPTDKGYRCYVDGMMQQADLPQTLKERIRGIIGAGEPTDLHLLMEATSRALSIATDQLGIILAPRLSRAVFRHIHIFEMEPHRYVLHMTIDSGFVRTLTVEVATEVGHERLEQACGIINDRFYGMRLAQMSVVEEDALSGAAAGVLGVVRLFVPSIKKMLQGEHDTEALYAEGETNIVLKPEFSDRERLGAVIEILGDRRMLMHLFDDGETQTGRVVVTIGGENKGGQFESFSVVKTRYRVGSLEGTLGILGPKRMPYPLLVAAVDYTARLLGEMHR
jgi:heat-inducible transcriptional repressor